MIITLTTDFGTADGFVGAMKGVILSIAPGAQIVDITHDIPSQDVQAGALALETAYSFFPAGTIHLAVVDPGVGSERAAIAIQTDRYFFVGPDNGVLSLALIAERRRAEEMKLRAENAVCLTNSAYHLLDVSATFHGRDIFAPVAAHLTRGIPLKQFGERVRRLAELKLPEVLISPSKLGVRVIHVDRFGNLITNLTRTAYRNWNRNSRDVVIGITGRAIEGLSRTFGDVEPGKLLAYFGSGGRLEIGVNQGNAAEILKARSGSLIAISFA